MVSISLHPLKRLSSDDKRDLRNLLVKSLLLLLKGHVSAEDTRKSYDGRNKVFVHSYIVTLTHTRKVILDRHGYDALSTNDDR